MYPFQFRKFYVHNSRNPTYYLKIKKLIWACFDAFFTKGCVNVQLFTDIGILQPDPMKLSMKLPMKFHSSVV